MYPNVPYGNNALTSRAIDIKIRLSWPHCLDCTYRLPFHFGLFPQNQPSPLWLASSLRPSSPSADTPFALAAMNQLNQQHLPYPIAGPNSPPEPGSSLRVPQEPVSEALTSISPGGGSPSSTGQDPLVAFYRHLQVQIDALTTLPEAERREKARLHAASRANDVRQLLDRRSVLAKMRPHMLPDAFAKHLADLQIAIKASYSDYVAHLCLTFRFNDLPMELLTEIFRFVIWPSTWFEADLKTAIDRKSVV